MTIYDLFRSIVYHINLLYIYIISYIAFTYFYTGFKKTSPTFRWSVLAQKKVLLRRAHVLLLPKISIVVGPEPRSWTPPEAGWDIWPTKNGDQNPTLGLHRAFGKWMLMDVYSFIHSKPFKTMQNHSRPFNAVEWMKIKIVGK